MLSDRSRPVIEATLPVVAENIEEIATRFYTHLFGEHPELLDGTFNRGNQAEKTQQMALAGSVAVFASALVKVPEQLPEHLLTRIAHKHASLGHHSGPVRRRPRQPVLGDRRRARRRRDARGGRRLGRGLLADGLRADQPGARPLQRPRRAAGDGLARVGGRREGPGDRRTSSRSGCAGPTTGWCRTSLPGQYVTVQVPMPDGVRQPRQYSLTRADDGEHRQFSVKRVRGGDKPDGEVSNLLCDSVDVGDRLTMSLPFGDVVLDDSGGPWCSPAPASGSPRWRACSPTWPTAGSHLPITVLHADVDEASFALRQQVLDDVAVAARRLGARLVRARRGQRRCPVEVHAGHDEPRRREAARTTPATTSAGRCRSCRPSAAR